MKIKLDDVLESIELSNDDISYVLDSKTGETLLYSDDSEVDADEFDIDDERYITLPGQWERDDYRIMQDFIAALPAGEARDQLADAIHGRGAFRMFRATVERQGLLQQWYAFKDEAYRQLAVDWCQQHGFDYE